MKRKIKTIGSLLVVACLAMCFALTACGDSHVHAVEKVAAKAATCTEDGYKEYWRCKDAECGKLFADEACTKEITAPEVIAATGHDLADVLTVTGAKTVYNAGETFDLARLNVTIACKHADCDGCAVENADLTAVPSVLAYSDTSVTVSAVLNDKTYSAEIAVIVNHTHALGPVTEAVPSDCVTAGSVAYYTCSVCGRFFADAAAKTEIADVTIAALGHDFSVSKHDETQHWHECVRGDAIDTKVDHVFSKIEITDGPQKTTYLDGEIFDKTGLTISESCECGISRSVAAERIVVPSAALVYGQKSVEVKVGELTGSVPVHVTYGKITKIEYSGDPIVVEAGADLSDIRATVHVTYESGREIDVAESSDDLKFSLLGGEAQIGKQYDIMVSAYDGSDVNTSIPVILKRTWQAEDATIVGGKANSQKEYKIIDGKYVDQGLNSFAGGFANAVKNGEDSYVSFNIFSVTDCDADLTLRCANSNIRHDDAGYYMADLQINTILDMTLNGGSIPIPDNVVLNGFEERNSEILPGGTTAYAPCYNVYDTFKFVDVPLVAGTNEIRLAFKTSTTGETNSWGDSPSEMNIDWIAMESRGNELPEGEVTAIEFDRGVAATIGEDFADVTFDVLATYSGGRKAAIDGSLLNMTKPQGKAEYGETYELVASLKSDASVTASTTIVTPDYCHIDTAFLEIVDGKVYYVLKGIYAGYTEEQCRMVLDNIPDGTAPSITIADKKIEIRYDVTGFDAGTTKHNPHLFFSEDDSLPYQNGENVNGDIFVSKDADMAVYLNGKIYEITNHYKMPSLLITASETGRFIKPVNAYLEEEEGRVYYYICGSSVGFAPVQFVYDFAYGNDKSDADNTVITTENGRFMIRVDVTDWTAEASAVYGYPHLKMSVDGTEVPHGTNKSGDVLLTCPMTLNASNGKTYVIVTKWSMPALQIKAS